MHERKKIEELVRLGIPEIREKLIALVIQIVESPSRKPARSLRKARRRLGIALRKAAEMEDNRIRKQRAAAKRAASDTEEKEQPQNSQKKGVEESEEFVRYIDCRDSEGVSTLVGIYKIQASYFRHPVYILQCPPNLSDLIDLQEIEQLDFSSPDEAQRFFEEKLEEGRNRKLSETDFDSMPPSFFRDLPRDHVLKSFELEGQTIFSIRFRMNEYREPNFYIAIDSRYLEYKEWIEFLFGEFCESFWDEMLTGHEYYKEVETAIGEFLSQITIEEIEEGSLY